METNTASSDNSGMNMMFVLGMVILVIAVIGFLFFQTSSLGRESGGNNEVQTVPAIPENIDVNINTSGQPNQ
jgi:hypothetical protein